MTFFKSAPLTVYNAPFYAVLSHIHAHTQKNLVTDMCCHS